jgi:hypothetical protein
LQELPEDAPLLLLLPGTQVIPRHCTALNLCCQVVALNKPDFFQACNSGQRETPMLNFSPDSEDLIDRQR